MLWPPILVSEPPAFADLAGTGLSPVLHPGRRRSGLGGESLGRAEERLVLQARLSTEGKRGRIRLSAQIRLSPKS